MLMGFSKLKKWPKSVQGWQRCRPKRVAVALSRAKVALRMFCTWPRKWTGRNACATFFAVSSLCLDRFCSFFRFSKSQYAFLKVIFYDFFCFDIHKKFYEQLYVREREEMCRKGYLPRNSTDSKSAAPVCKSMSQQLIFRIFSKSVNSRYKGFVFKVQKWLQPLLLGEEHQVLALRTVFLNNKKVY